MVHDCFEAGTKVFGGQRHQIFRPVYNTHVSLDNGMSTPMHRETKPATIGVDVSHGAFSDWWKSKYPAVEKFLFSSFALCRFGSLLWWSRFSQLALFNSPRSTGPIHYLRLHQCCLELFSSSFGLASLLSALLEHGTWWNMSQRYVRDGVSQVDFVYCGSLAMLNIRTSVLVW